MKVRPRIEVLTSEQIEKVHSDSVKILSTCGIRVDSAKARIIFSKTIGNSADEEIVKIPESIVNYAIKSVPDSIPVFNRLGEKAFTLNASQNIQTRFGIGVTNLWYQEPENDTVLPFSRKYIETATRLGDTLNSFDVISTPGVIKDSSVKLPELTAALEMTANSAKPMIILVSNTEQFKHVLDLFTYLHGDLSGKPFIIPYFNPVTPFVLNEETTDKIFLAIEHGLPFIFSNYGMSGATTPITAAGTLVTLNAELLAGLVFTQLVKEGTPMLLGSLPSVFEMKNMFSAYTSQTMLLNLACAEMMAHYGIIHCGTSGSGTGWGPDLLASGTLWMNHLSSCLGKAGLAPFVGGNFDSLAFSPAMVVYANEIIRQARLFADGFKLDNDSINIESIISTGPGGNFFMSEQTLTMFREIHQQHSQIWPGYSLEKWLENGSPKAIRLLREHTIELIENLESPEDHDEMIAKGEIFINKITKK
jgi:trimethylamine:corrinoid methyltransferase-like protein